MVFENNKVVISNGVKTYAFSFIKNGFIFLDTIMSSIFKGSSVTFVSIDNSDHVESTEWHTRFDHIGQDMTG